MKLGKERFLFFINKIELLIESSKSEENIAKYVFLNDLRTPMFMLEGLSKMYSKINDEEIFTELKEQFKTIEDALGAIDFFAAYKNEFAANKKIKTAIIEYFQENENKKLEEFGAILIEQNWLNGVKIEEIKNILNQIDWDKEEKEIEKIKKYYKKQIEKINEFVVEIGYPFHDVEENIHELRRRVRWLSIYPQALRGAIQLIDIEPIAYHLQKYQLPEIVNSKYNIMPEAGPHSYFLNVNKQKFFALSWYILKMGTLKDYGLKINALKEAFKIKISLNEVASETETYALLGNKQPSQADVLEKASEISKIFFEENNLDFIEN